MEGPAQLSLDIRGEAPRVPVAHIAKQREVLESLEGRYIDEYISPDEEANFLNRIDESQWIQELRRRVQHYGYRYDYRARKISRDMHIGDLPEWVSQLAERLGEGFFYGKRPDQMIVNEYHSGQGIARHVDCEPCFGPVVVSISLNSTCVMDLRKKRTIATESRVTADGNDKIELFLERRSAVILRGESRYNWTHGIAPRKKDKIAGIEYGRTRRVSLTFRSVIKEEV